MTTLCEIDMRNCSIPEASQYLLLLFCTAFVFTINEYRSNEKEREKKIKAKKQWKNHPGSFPLYGVDVFQLI